MAARLEDEREVTISLINLDTLPGDHVVEEVTVVPGAVKATVVEL